MVRDDLNKDAEYARSANHDDAHGVAVRKKVYKVTIILSVITFVEVAAGIMWPRTDVGEGFWLMIKLAYIALTVIKAAYIVLVFMHLGDETKNFKYMILVPYILFILYLLYIAFVEAVYVNEVTRPFW